MDSSNFLTLLFGLIATILGVLLKAEYDKRTLLQQQVSEYKRNAYGEFIEVINDLQISRLGTNPKKNQEAASKRLMELRNRIWQYGSDKVIKSYSLWLQSNFISNDQNNLAGLILMADVIIKMREDMGLSKPNSVTPLDILRISVNDIEENYNAATMAARAFRKKMRLTKHKSY